MQLAEFQRQVSKCTVCADPEFTAVLLSQLPNVIDCENPEHVQQAVKLQQVLADLACVAPLSTDAVESLHGFTQTKLHRFRGSRPTDPAAREISVWGKICSAWNVIKTWIWDRTGDVQVNRRLAKYHNKSASADPSKERTRLKLIFSHLQMLSNAGPGDDGRFKQKRLCGHFSEDDSCLLFATVC